MKTPELNIDSFQEWFQSCGWDKTNLEFYQQGMAIIELARHCKFEQKEIRDIIVNQTVAALKQQTNVFFGNTATLIEHLDNAIQSSQSRIAELERTVSFFASVIKSGESWTETCQKAYDSAINQEG